MRPAAIDRVGIVIGGDAWPFRICEAHTAGEPLRPRIGPEVVIEATVLLHDEDEVLEFLEPERRPRSVGGTRFTAYAPELVLCTQALGTCEHDADA